ncbi:MAG TPA: HAD family hydrolase [Alphaproteobacteria bacterium]|nr:HAD family hydrolase [Alphaproteobacteria bacterium]
MAKVDVGNGVYDIDLAAFDKDGTLIDFYHLWGRKARVAVEAVVARLCGDAGLAEQLYRSIGYDPATGLAAPDGPLTIASMAKLYAICATVLYQQGLSWHEADDIAQKTFAGGLGALPTGDLVRPVGDVRQLFQRLAGAGVKVTVVTSDDRTPTLATLELLGVACYVAGIVCGDDPIPNKPAPDSLLYLSREFAVPVERIMMVGDTPGDISTGKSAGVGCCVGLLSGAGKRGDLAPHADAVLTSIDDIRVIG